MANPFDDPNFGKPANANPFDDPKFGAAPTGNTGWKGLVADSLMYGATPLMPLVLAARQGALGPSAKAAIEGGRRTERSGLQGVSDSIADAAGLPVDLASAALKAIPRALAMPANAVAGRQVADPDTPTPGFNPPPDAPGSSQFWRKALDYAGTLPSRAVDAVNQGSAAPLTDDRTGRVTPQDMQERLAYGFGKGAGAAATSFVPAGMVAQAAAPMTATRGVAQNLATRPVAQAVGGGISGAVTEETGNPWLGMAAGTGAVAAKDLAGGLLRRAVTPAMQLTPDEQRIAAAALSRDIPLTPGQATGSKGLNLFEQTMRRLPVAGNMADRGFDQQRQALNREITALAGGASDRAGPDVIDRLYRTAGANFDDLLTRQGQVNITPQTATDIAGVVQNYGRRLPTDVARTFNSYIEDLTPVLQAAQSGQSPQVSAQWYQNVRSDLNRRLRGLDHGDPLHDALMGIRNTLDDAAAATRPDLAPEWQQARQQYANLSTLDKSMRGAPAADASSGNVPLGQFRNAVRGADPEGFARGRGDLNELAQIAGFLQNRVPNSGTPERLAMTGLLAGGGIFEPTTAATALGVPAALQAAYSSKPVRQMLTTRPGPLMGQTAPVAESLMLQRLAAALQGGALAPR